MSPSPKALVLITLIGFTLAGCDAAEESAQNLAEKAEQAVQELAREAVSDTVNTVNERIDQAQKSTRELLSPPAEEKAADPPEREADAASGSSRKGIET